MKYTPASNEKSCNLAVVCVPGSGKPRILTNSSYDGGWMIWQRSSLSVYIAGYITPAPAFTDTVGHWAKDNIDFAVSRGLMTGTSATTFFPGALITRTTLLMALGKPCRLQKIPPFHRGRMPFCVNSEEYLTNISLIASI